MTKPLKRGLEYFPLDTDLVRDLKIRRLVLAFGCEGLSVFIAVLCEAYASEGYYVAVKSGFYNDSGFMLGLKPERIRDIVGYCVEIGLFDRRMYEEKMILTSYGIQQRYQTIHIRKTNRIKEEFLVVRECSFPDEKMTSHININKNIDVILKERKEKERKEKEREEKEREEKEREEKEREEKERKEKENKEKENQEKTNKNKIENYGNEKSIQPNDDSARRAELLSMAEIATGSRYNV